MAKKNGEKSHAILNAAKEVFAEVGYHNASISKIAKRAGIGDGTVYLYFENKESILITLQHETLYNQLIPKLKENLTYYEDARLQLFQLIETHYKFFNEDIVLAKVLQVELRQTSPTIREAIKQVLIVNFDIIESVVSKGQEEGVFREDLSVRDARKLIFGTLDEMVTCWVLSEKKYSLLKRVEPTYKMFLQALIKMPVSPL